MEMTDKKRIRAQNKYDHHSGRDGYKKEEAKLRRELGREPTQWDRADMWCNIRRQARKLHSGSRPRSSKDCKYNFNIRYLLTF